MSLQNEILLILEQLYRHLPLHDLDADLNTLTPGPESRAAAIRIGALLHEGGSLPTHTVEDRRRFRRTWKLMEKTGACDGWGSAESRRAWKEFLAAGCPEDILAFIYEAANPDAPDDYEGVTPAEILEHRAGRVQEIRDYIERHKTERAASADGQPQPEPTDEKVRRVEEIKARIKAKQNRKFRSVETLVTPEMARELLGREPGPGDIPLHLRPEQVEALKADILAGRWKPAGYCALCRAKELEMYGDVLCEAGPKHDAACRAAGCLHPFDYGQT